MQGINYVKKNEELLAEWKVSNSRRYNETNFAPDGIMYKGEVSTYEIESGKFGYYRKQSEDGEEENKSWALAKPRILFVTKDQNAGKESAWDVRTEIGRRDIKRHCIQSAFYRNLMYQLFGIHNTTSSKVADFEFQNKEAIDLFDNYPLARINIKKEAGESRISNRTVKDYLERDAQFIEKQIKILDPDIIFCCGYSANIECTGNLILNFLNEHGYNFVQFDCWIYYDESSNTIAINNYHLSVLNPPHAKIYREMTESYNKFLKQYPSFMEKIQSRL